LEIEDVTLKGFLQKTQELSRAKIDKILAMEPFRYLLGDVSVANLGDGLVPMEIQLEFEFEGIPLSTECQVVRIPIGRHERLRLTLRKLG
jgi:ribosome-associated toxin RatA of RatAB toxin-antitoxin module